MKMKCLITKVDLDIEAGPPFLQGRS